MFTLRNTTTIKMSKSKRNLGSRESCEYVKDGYQYPLNLSVCTYGVLGSDRQMDVSQCLSQERMEMRAHRNKS